MALTTPAEVQQAAPTSEQAKTILGLRLPEFFVGQQTGFDNDQVKRTETLRRLYGETDTISGLSKRVYAEVLTDEYMAMKKLMEQNPSMQAPEWQNNFEDALQLAFRERYGAKDMSTISRQEKLDLYKAVFNQLLNDQNQDEVRKWVHAGMVSAQHQIVAMQAVTRATYSGLEADKLEYISEPKIASPYLDTDETGVDEVFTKTNQEIDKRNREARKGHRFTPWRRPVKIPSVEPSSNIQRIKS